MIKVITAIRILTIILIELFKQNPDSRDDKKARCD